MGLLGNPRQGGLNAMNLLNEFINPDAEGGGLRAFMLPDGTYGGSMMPKTRGHQGIIEGLLGRNITEYSSGGVNGEPFFPTVTENLYDGQLDTVKRLEAGLIERNSEEAQRLQRHAYEEYLRRTNLGQSAFKDNI